MNNDQETAYRLGTAGSGLWLAFVPSGQDPNRTWQMQVSVRGRGGKHLSTLLQTTALRPLGTVTIKGQSYPLLIDRHERKTGGLLCFGGERKIGQDGVLRWEMQMRPDAAKSGRCDVEMRLQASPRRTGDVTLSFHLPLHCPALWSLGAAALRGHCAHSVHSTLSRYAVQLVTMEEAAGWNKATSSLELACSRFPFGGGRPIRFRLGLLPAENASEVHSTLVQEYADLASLSLHPLTDLPVCHSSAAASLLTDPSRYAVRGAERLYLHVPGIDPESAETFHAGFPHYPLDALRALWDWNRFHPSPEPPRLVRYGAIGVATDFQVLGNGGQAEPNKGAFWDKRTAGVGSDAQGGATHGIASSARIARTLFGLHEAISEPLLRQSALNTCQWLILKSNESGFYEGDRVLATRGLPDDGHVLSRPCALAGAEAIRPLVLAFRTTRSEVFIKAAWKIANHLIETQLSDFEGAAPPAVATVVLALIALNSEAPHAKLQAALEIWGAWLRVLPLETDAPELNADGLYAGLYDCAEAGFALFTLLHDTAFLRYAFAALGMVPETVRPQAWRELALRAPALLSLAALLPSARPDLGAISVALDWRIYTPDPATHEYIRVEAPGGGLVQYMPLVCRQDDQLMLLVLAPRDVEQVSIFKNGRRPLVRDLLSGTLDTNAVLHSPGGEKWARVGLFTIDS